MGAVDLIIKKRNGGELSQEIRYLIANHVAGGYPITR